MLSESLTYILNVSFFQISFRFSRSHPPNFHHFYSISLGFYSYLYPHLPDSIHVHNYYLLSLTVNLEDVSPRGGTVSYYI